MKLKRALFGVAAMLILAGTHAKAQLIISGSSAIYLETGQASAAQSGCAWTTSSKTFTLNDSRLTVGGADTATAWVTWKPTSGACSTPVVGSEIAYLSTDSTVGTRCFFAVPACTITTTSASGAAGSNALPGVTDSLLPAQVLTDIQGKSINVAATDIRPEDGKFASLRTVTTCGTPVVAGSQYLGLGYSNGGVISGASGIAGVTSPGSFNVADFNIYGNDPISGNPVQTGWVVTPVSATPVVVFVNPTNTTGFGSLLVSNIDRATLAGFLDGTYGRPSDVIGQTYSLSNSPTTVFVREPLSGTYNTMEFAIPNSVQNQTSQDVGLAALNAYNITGNPLPKLYCASGTPGGASGTNPLNESTARGSGTSLRQRVIGTGNMVKAVLNANTDALGYSFWSAANFGSATSSNAKYLTVDGIDPLQQDWTDGLVPTSGNDLLGNVTMAHVKDGSYPIWTIQRFISSAANKTALQALATAAANFLSPSQPDFVPLNQLSLVRSHFAPPGINFSSTNAPCNGTGGCAEAGGDVAGLVYTLQADGDYNKDNGANTGNVGHRQ